MIQGKSKGRHDIDLRPYKIRTEIVYSDILKMEYAFSSEAPGVGERFALGMFAKGKSHHNFIIRHISGDSTTTILLRLNKDHLRFRERLQALSGKELGVLYSTQVPALGGPTGLHPISEVMSASAFRRAGLLKLTDEELRELDIWLGLNLNRLVRQ